MHNWKKRAVEMSMQAIIVAVIALVVLVVVIVIFKAQIGKASQRLFGIGEQAASEANTTNKCESLFGNRKCLSSCAAVPINGTNPSRSIYYAQLPGDWVDCKLKSLVCCERVE